MAASADHGSYTFGYTVHRVQGTEPSDAALVEARQRWERSKERLRRVWCVGAAVGWPPEIYVLFADAEQARRHADRAAYNFDVFPMPVFAAADEANIIRRAAGPTLGLLLNELTGLGAKLHDGDPMPVHAIGAWEAQGEPEVHALFENQTEAARHAADALWMTEQRQLRVFARYEDCPANLRFDRGAGALSQLVVAKDQRRR